MSLPVDPTLDELAKRQKLCLDVTRSSLETSQVLVNDALSSLRESGSTTALKQLATALKKRKIAKVAGQATVEYHASIRQLGTMLDERFSLPISEAARPERLDSKVINQVILNHMFREGLFESGEALVAEAGLPEGEANETKATFARMHELLTQIRSGELAAALAWVRSNRSVLGKEGTPTALEFRILCLMYLRTLQVEGVSAALQFARSHFAPFQETFFSQIKKLMGCLVYANKPLHETPYHDLASDKLLDQVASDFVKAACGTLGQASHSPLAVTVAAGSVALPQLLKMIKVSKGTIVSAPSVTTLTQDDHMPLEIELGPEFTFHSIFACPVSKEQALNDNPPHMLPCGHVLSLQTIDNLAGMRQTFKCPYCPEETSKEHCRHLHFPDVQ